jgi:multiple sugar transport system substrate-binding protein
MQRLMKEYVEDDTGITVEVSLFPYANLFEKTRSVLSSQSGSFDMTYMDDPWFPQLAPHLEPLEDWVPNAIPKDQLIDTAIDITTWPAPRGPTVPSAQGMDQRIRGQVVVGNTQLFVYNSRLFEAVDESGPPETWDDVYRVGQKISEQIDGANGYVIRGKQGNPINANFFSLGNSLAGPMFTDDWRYRWDESAGVSAVDFYVNDLKSISPDGVASFDSDQTNSAVADGTAAMMPSWPGTASLLLNSDKSAEADNLEFTQIPKGQTRNPQQGNWIMGINKYTTDEKKRAAGEVLQSFASKEAQNTYVDLGGVPFRHDTFKDNMDAQPWFPALYESLQNALWRPRTPLWNEIAVAQGRGLSSALTDKSSPEKATTRINNDVESILKNAGYYG